MSARKRTPATSSAQETPSKIPVKQTGNSGSPALKSKKDSAPEVVMIDMEEEEKIAAVKRGLKNTQKEVPSGSRGSRRGQSPGIGTPSPILPSKGGSGGGGSGSGVSQVRRLMDAAKMVNAKRDSPKAKAHKFKGISWVDRNYPQNSSDLFVNKRKVDEVKEWLKSAVQLIEKQNPRGSKICVLTGPSGVGKTATLFLLAKEMNLEIKEWINPPDLTDFVRDRLGKYDPDDVQGKSQFEMFSNFLFRASQYNSLKIVGRPHLENKIVVVEDFPNIFYRNPDMFHNNILRPYAAMGVFPVVFIVADSSSRECNVNSLFPKPILQELNIGYINFNAVATSFMMKFLQSVCEKEGATIDKLAMESIAAASGGDIRSAINTLQFKLSDGKDAVKSNGIFKKPPARKAASKKAGNDPKALLEEAVTKDETLFLFRALGKVLYAKRNGAEICDSDKEIPASAVQYLRHSPLQENPEELVHKIEQTGEVFLNFLQQNYVQFFGSTDDIVTASSLLADAEFMLSRWAFDDSGTVSRTFKEHESREEVALLVACRGLMYANVKKVPNVWRPLKKPMFGDLRTKLQKSVDRARQLFPGEGAVRENFYTEILPFYAKLALKNPRVWPKEQFNFIKEVGLMQRGYRQNLHDTLQERDAVDVDGLSSGDEQEDSAPTDSNPEEKGSADTIEVNIPLPTMSKPAEYSDEEFEIEDYDDD